VNKADLIEKIAKDAGINKTQADDAINSVLKGVQEALKKGDRVTLVGFGTFSVGHRKARTGRNPQTGKPIKIAAKKVAKFTPGAELKSAVNKKK
jgi:DNA-binding protein HU-beta